MIFEQESMTLARTSFGFSKFPSLQIHLGIVGFPLYSTLTPPTSSTWLSSARYSLSPIKLVSSTSLEAWNLWVLEILSTGGTAKHLADNGVKVKEVSDYTEFPEMFDGRVKTLHPKIRRWIASAT